MLFRKDLVYKCNASLNMSHIIGVLNCSLLNKVYCKTHCYSWCKRLIGCPESVGKILLTCKIVTAYGCIEEGNFDSKL